MQQPDIDVPSTIQHGTWMPGCCMDDGTSMPGCCIVNGTSMPGCCIVNGTSMSGCGMVSCTYICQTDSTAIHMSNSTTHIQPDSLVRNQSSCSLSIKPVRSIQPSSPNQIPAMQSPEKINLDSHKIQCVYLNKILLHTEKSILNNIHKFSFTLIHVTTCILNFWDYC
jgi:hypothetical protein